MPDTFNLGDPLPNLNLFPRPSARTTSTIIPSTRKKNRKTPPPNHVQLGRPLTYFTGIHVHPRETIECARESDGWSAAAAAAIAAVVSADATDAAVSADAAEAVAASTTATAAAAATGTRDVWVRFVCPGSITATTTTTWREQPFDTNHDDDRDQPQGYPLDPGDPERVLTGFKLGWV